MSGGAGEGSRGVERFTLRIDSLAAGGDGVGRDASGRVTFVPRSAPGDRVRVRLVEEHARFARGELEEILEPGPDRVEPPCPLFADASCGGCQWQHVSAPAQAAAKQSIVASALRHLIEGGMSLEPIATPVPAFGWRRRVRLHWFRPRGAEAALIGLFAPGSRRVTRVERCPQMEPALEAALPPLHHLLAPGLEKRGEIEVLVGAEGRLHVAVHGPCRPAAVRRLAEEPGIAGVRAGKRQLGEPQVPLEGGLSGRADQFAQASAEGNRALLDAVRRAAGPLEGARVLELFAGSGNLTRVLGAASRVVAVDRRPGPGAEGVEWKKGRAAEVTRELAEAGARFDLAVLDPPREGAREVVAPLAELAPPRILYVSCDPATLARDLQRLVEHGYQPERAQPLDLMPQTSHIEVVATLRLQPPK